MERISVLLTGDYDSPEFASARTRLAATTALRVLPLDDAPRALEEAGAALVVVAKSFPDQFSATRIEALRRAAPLARLIALEGSWCESEGRTGQPWPGVARVAWWAAEAALVRETQALAESQASRWSGPATAAPFEQALWESELPLVRGSGSVLIDASSDEQRAWIAGACREFGYQPVATNEDATNLVAAIRQATPKEASDSRWLSRFVGTIARHAVPTLVLLDFPRRQDVAAMTAAGAAGVMGLPCSLLDLSTALSLAIERSYSAPSILRRSENDM